MTETFSIRSAGDRVWHIPGQNGTPLCGDILWRPERRYLPAALAPDDVICTRCTALQRAAKGGPTAPNG